MKILIKTTYVCVQTPDAVLVILQITKKVKIADMAHRALNVY